MRRSAPALAGVALLVAGCSLQRGDRLFAAGDHAAAARLYERTSYSWLSGDGRSARALLRLAVAYALPESSVHDPRHARRVLERVQALYPGTAHAREARLLLARLAVGEAIAEHGERLGELGEELALVDGEEAALRAALAAEQTRATELAERVAALDAEARRLKAEIARLEAELEQLKAIDLGIPDPSGER